MNAEIITVGTELLLGDIVNSNSQFLSRELAAYGIQMLYQSTVGDNNARLKQVLSLALSRSDMVCITGGLGPTPDDLTRETVCEALDLRQQLHEESWSRIQEYFANTGKELGPSNQKQAMLPENCIVFPNDHGTAPGCAVEKDGHVLILLPGPPRELIPMFNTYVAPYLSKFSGGTIFSRTVGVFGIPESTVAERLSDLLSQANPTVAPYAKDGEVTLRVTARAAGPQAAAQLCDPVVEEIRSRLGANVYGVDSGSLQKAVVTLLIEKQKKIATAESCTAGILSGRLTEVAGVSSVFECGIASYSNEIKHQVLGVSKELLEKYGAVSPEVACAMAVGVRRVGQADLGVGITGVAGPDTSEGKPVGTVYIALADEKRTWVKKIMAGHSANEREYVRFIATSHALDLVRRYLEALPAVMAGGELLAGPAEEEDVIPVTPKSGEPRRFLSLLFPWKGDSPFHFWMKLAIWVIAAIVLVAGAFTFHHYVLEPASNQRLYRDLSDLYAQHPDAPPPSVNIQNQLEGMNSRFYGLFTRNGDVAGWIKIDGTRIDYPVMKDPGGGFYRNHNYDGRSSAYGVPYFDSSAALISSQSVNRTLTVYGNNTGDGQMFSDLILYKELDFLRSHPLAEMNSLYANQKWKIFGVMVVDENDQTFRYTRTTFQDAEDFLAFAAELRERSLFHTPIDVLESDRLLFLSTNAEQEWDFTGARLVVCARAVRDGESETADMTGAAENPDVRMPEAYRSPGGNTTRRPLRTEGRTSAAAASAPSSSETVPTEESAVSSASGQTSQSTAASSIQTSVGQSTAAVSSAVQTTTTTATSAPPPSGDKPIPPTSTVKPGTKPESEFLKDFALEVKGEETFHPSNKEELQLALSKILKIEMGNQRASQKSTAALEAQAVAAYTCVLAQKKPYVIDPESLKSKTFKFDQNTDQNDNRIYTAVGKVVGTKILQDGKPIETLYFASSAGATANNRYVFGTPLDYLKSVDSPYDTPAYIRKFGGAEEDIESFYTFSLNELEKKVEEYLQDKYSKAVSISRELQSGKPPVYARSHDESERYVASINISYAIDGKKNYLTGYQLRCALGLRSHCFFVDTYDEDTVTFRVTGHGHGLGLSQYGAMGYANEAGWNYMEILTHYYSITPNSKHQIVDPKWN